MTDAQALHRWLAAELANRKGQPEARMISAISDLSTRDAIRLIVLGVMTDIELPDLDKSKDAG